MGAKLVYFKGEVRGQAKKDVKDRSRSLVFTPLPERFFFGGGEGGKSAPPPSFSEASKVKVMTFSKVVYSFIENEHKWCYD